MTSPGGPGGREVGRVSIRVVPDTSRFRRELKDQLEALPDTDYEFDAKGNVDEKQLAREVRSAARAAGASVDIDANFRKSALDQIQQYGKQLTAAGKDLDIIQEATNGLVAKIGLEVDPRSKKSWRADINEELSSLRGLALDLTPRLDEQGTRDLKARVAALKVPVEVEVNRRSLSRALTAITAGIGNSLSSFLATAKIGAQAVQSGLAGLAKGFKGAANAASRFGEAGAIVAAVLAFAAPALSLLTGALVAVPAAMAAFAVPAGAIALGLEGIKKAAETAAPALGKLKAAVSETFAKDLLPGFQQISDRLLPGITEGMKGVAASLSTVFNGFIDTLAGPEGLNNLQTTIDNVARAASAATPGVQSFTDGLNTLVAKLSGGFPGVAEWFNGLGDDFSAWIDKITANGELDTAMTNLKNTLGEIGGTLGDIAKWSWDNLADPAFGEKMRQFAADLRSIVNDILPLLKSGFEDIADIINGIVSAIDKVKGAAKGFENLTGGKEPTNLKDQKELWGGLSDFGINDNANIVKWLGLQRGGIAKEAAAAGSEAGKKFQENLAAAASATSGDAGALTDAINNQLTSAIDVSKGAQTEALKSAFAGTGVTDAVKAQIGTQMTGVITEAQAAITQLGPVLQQGIDQAVLPLSTLPEKVGQAFGVLGPSITGAWTVVSDAVTAGVQQMTTTISTAFTTLPQTVTTAFTGIQQSVTGAFGLMVLSIGAQAQNINVAIGNAFNQIPATISGALGQAVTATAGAASQIVSALRTPLEQLPALVTAAFEPMTATVTTAMTTLVQAVVTGGTQVVAEVQTWPGRISSILDTLSSTASASGAAVGREFAAGIASQAGAVAASAEGLVNAARKFFPNSPAETGPFSGSGWVDKSGASIGVSFADGISSSMKGVVSTARELMQAVKDVFGSAEGLTINFNLGGVADQAQAATTAVKDFGTAVGTIPPAQLKSLQPEVSAQESQFSKDELDRQLAVLEIERKSLEIERAKTGANEAAIKARLEEIKQQKLQLGLQKNQLDYATKYGEQTDSMTTKMNQFYQDIGKKVVGLPTDFAKNVGGEFMNDLGISGQGAIPNLINEGVNYIFQVSDMQSALTAQRTLVNKQAAGVTQR